MKEVYSKPIAEIEKFSQVEILTLSGTEGGLGRHLTISA